MKKNYQTPALEIQETVINHVICTTSVDPEDGLDWGGDTDESQP